MICHDVFWQLRTRLGRARFCALAASRMSGWSLQVTPFVSTSFCQTDSGEMLKEMIEQDWKILTGNSLSNFIKDITWDVSKEIERMSFGDHFWRVHGTACVCACVFLKLGCPLLYGGIDHKRLELKEDVKRFWKLQTVFHSLRHAKASWFWWCRLGCWLLRCWHGEPNKCTTMLAADVGLRTYE